MREIKFRFFDKQKNYMAYAGPETGLTDGDLLDYGMKAGYPVMQFTGLRDKNGVKIFEGDIVDFNGGDICEVIFENGCFWAANEQLSKHPIGQWLHYSESAVVIGNIHQHPHLLEQRK